MLGLNATIRLSYNETLCLNGLISIRHISIRRIESQNSVCLKAGKVHGCQADLVITHTSHGLQVKYDVGLRLVVFNWVTF